MSANLYFPAFMLSVTFFCLVVGLQFANSPDFTRQEKGNPDMVLPFCLCVAYAIFLGSRPLSPLFGDTFSYTLIYNKYEPSFIDIDWHSEWLWQWLMSLSKIQGFSVGGFFTMIDLLYFLTGLFAVRNFMPNNVLLGLLFMFASLMFYTFAINGIRNGLACHILLLAFSIYLLGNIPVSVVLALLAFGIHRSVMLPIASFVASVFFVKNLRLAFAVWGASIILSLVAGGWFTAFFASLGFDDRMTTYTQGQVVSGEFSRAGFRWDFLLYSAMPVAMGWYVCVKKQISERWYNILCSTYCLANAFWVLVIRAEYSNRFAYLSWFLYPIVIAYPLIQIPMSEDQDRLTAFILFAYVGFTLLMDYLWHMF